MIQNPAQLSLSKGQLKLLNDDGEHTLPLEDITALILESPQITLSSTLLSACQDANIAVLTCDKAHIPNGLMLPFQPHSRQSRVAHIQISCSDSLKGRLWQRVVKSKINNQAQCLSNSKDADAATRLLALVDRVEPADAKNTEAQAARDYWPKLMGDDFKRSGNCIINAALNYGYAIIRAYVARSQVAYGLIPAFGIHHANQLNAFNLTDDIMEVFRPFVDRLVLNLKNTDELNSQEATLSKETRAKLAAIGNEICAIDGQNHTIANASDKLAASLVSAMELKNPSALNLPEFAKA